MSLALSVNTPIMVAMYIEAVPNRSSPPTILLRESYRENGKVKKRTLCNLTGWPPRIVEGLRVLFKGGTAVADLSESLEVCRSRAYGHVGATLGMLRQLKLERALDPQPSPERDRVVAMIVARILYPGSKLSTARALTKDAKRDALADELGLGRLDEDDLYAALDWLRARQAKIERRLARRHLEEGSLVLYDLSSTYLEGRRCPLARHGYSRDRKRGKLQIEFGLLCDREGRPLAVEVFEGNAADPSTVAPQIEKLQRFGLKRLVLVGDRGMLTEARIREDVRPSGMDWISALRGPAIRSLVKAGAVQLSLFDERDLVEVRSPEYPGERLMVCRNPLLAEERARKREELLAATEARLEKIAVATRRESNRLSGQDRIGLRAGKAIGLHKMGKHFELVIGDDSFEYRRKSESIAAEAALDGLYVIRTSLPEERMDGEETVRAYKSLSRVERAFRSLKSVDLKLRPVYHYSAERVRAHVLLCALAYYVEWHMRERLKPLLFADEEAPAPESVVAPAKVSESARRKASRKRGAGGLPAQSFRSLLHDLASLSRIRVEPLIKGAPSFETLERPSALHREAFRLLGLRLG